MAAEDTSAKAKEFVMVTKVKRRVGLDEVQCILRDEYGPDQCVDPGCTLVNPDEGVPHRPPPSSPIPSQHQGQQR
jgi:hypothetical protein